MNSVTSDSTSISHDLPGVLLFITRQVIAKQLIFPLYKIVGWRGAFFFIIKLFSITTVKLELHSK